MTALILFLYYKVLEFDEPAKLLSNSRSEFAKMVSAAASMDEETHEEPPSPITEIDSSSHKLNFSSGNTEFHNAAFIQDSDEEPELQTTAL